MPDMFNVQMNVAEAPAATKAHSVQSSNAPSSESSDSSFKSVLEKELPRAQQSTSDTSKETATQPDKATAQPVEAGDNNSAEGVDVGTQPAQLVLQTAAQTAAKMTAETDAEPTAQTLLTETIFDTSSTEEEVAPLIINLTGSTQKKKQDIISQFTSSFKTTDSSAETGVKIDDTTVSSKITTSGEQQSSSTAATTTQQTASDNLTTKSDSLKSLAPQQEALLLRIQNLIEKGDVGTVTIQRTALSDDSASLRQQLALLSAVQVQEVDESQLQMGRVGISTGGFTELEDSVFGQTLRGRQQLLTGIRQDATHQFYDAKTQPQNSSSDTATSGGNQQGGEMAQQGSGFNQPTILASQGETTSTFSISSTSTLDTTATQSLDTSKATVLPSGTLVHDQEVIQQLVERFQINRRTMDSKIQMKLHPAELGEMEIDLTVKEGSIRANVVAQSQHVQEILERNLNRLKSVLEQQGFSIEEISITTGSDMVGEFDLFDQQLPNREQNSFAGNTQELDSLTPFVVEEIEGNTPEVQSGVNVKV